MPGKQNFSKPGPDHHPTGTSRISTLGMDTRARKISGTKSSGASSSRDQETEASSIPSSREIVDEEDGEADFTLSSVRSIRR